MLQRNVQVQLIALPPTPISSSATSPTFFIGHILHPAGNIAQLLVANGLARCIDQHAALLGADGMSGFRSAEKAAKSARKGIWSELPAPPNAASNLNGTPSSGSKHPLQVVNKHFEGIVSRIWNAESLSVRKGKHGEEEEIKVFLASVRQPKATESKHAGLRTEAQEYLRKRSIGKHVNVVIEYSQPKQEQ